jgi:hypothetical protein
MTNRAYQHRDGCSVQVSMDRITYYGLKSLIDYDRHHGRPQSMTAIINDVMGRYVRRRKKDILAGMELNDDLNQLV